MSTPEHKEESILFKKIIEVMNGSHNAFYRGKDITDLFYDGTLSKQIKAGTFDDIFIGDYIIGKTSKIKYLVADIDYRLKGGDTATNTHHIIMLPECVMGIEIMNSANTTNGAYGNSEMRTQTLEKYREIIRSDFGTEHILKHKNLFANAVANGSESTAESYETDIDLMSEIMVYGTNIFHNALSSTSILDTTQLALFRLKPALMLAGEQNVSSRKTWWLRDVVSATAFATVGSIKVARANNATQSNVGVRPAFLIY